MKKFGQVTSLVILLYFFMGCSQKQAFEWIPFSWEGDSISGKYIEKAYLYIPVKVEDIPYNFTMQLDLGTYTSLFYGVSLDPYLEEFTSLTDKLDFDKVWFENVNLKMGTVEFDSVNIGYYKNFGKEIPEDSLHSKTPKHIGTIAPDLFQNKIVVIDYKLSRLAVLDNLPEEYKDLPAEEFDLIDGIMKLPFHINGKEYKLMFDTGSSPFPLATSRERALEISNSVITDSLSGPLWWGNDITFYGLEVNKPIEFGGKALKNSLVYYDKDGLWEREVFVPLDIWGLTGNAYFFDNTVIIDYKNKLFRVK